MTDVREIALGRGYVALVDAVDYDRVMALGRRWFASVRRGQVYARRNARPGEETYMHRVVVEATAGSEVDHWDGNGLNNTRGNLRVCSRIENNRNSRKGAGWSARYKGVYRNHRERWVAQIRVNGVARYLGSFTSEDQAAHAYNAAAIEAFGSFAHLNAPTESARPFQAPKSPLSAIEVVEIRRRYAAGGVSQVSLSRDFGVDPSTVSLCLRGLTHARV
jgi:hypothetical protein